MPILESRNLNDSPEEIIAVVCAELLEEEECRKRLNGYRTTWKEGGVQEFYEELSKLEEKIQDKCLDAILDGLTKMQGAAGLEHIKKTLEEGNADFYRISLETSKLELVAVVSCCCVVTCVVVVVVVLLFLSLCCCHVFALRSKPAKHANMYLRCNISVSEVDIPDECLKVISDTDKCARFPGSKTFVVVVVVVVVVLR